MGWFCSQLPSLLGTLRGMAQRPLARLFHQLFPSCTLAMKRRGLQISAWGDWVWTPRFCVSTTRLSSWSQEKGHGQHTVSQSRRQTHKLSFLKSGISFIFLMLETLWDKWQLYFVRLKASAKALRMPVPQTSWSCTTQMNQVNFCLQQNTGRGLTSSILFLIPGPQSHPKPTGMWAALQVGRFSTFKWCCTEIHQP